jgi:hypothetical protein
MVLPTAKLRSRAPTVADARCDREEKAVDACQENVEEERHEVPVVGITSREVTESYRRAMMGCYGS